MITALIQARVNSTRLPKKVLLPLNGKTVLENVVERVKKAKSISKIVVVTSREKSDDPIAALCKKKKIICYRGSLEDVLDRFYQAAKSLKAEHLCRITADCPLIDADVIDLVAEHYTEGQYDYAATNGSVHTPSFPDGLDTEIFSFKALERAWREAKLQSEREHVTPYIWKNPKKFKTFGLVSPVNRAHYRLTIDEPEDYELIKAIYKNVKPLTTENIITYIDMNKPIKNINKHIVRDEGYYKSLKQDVIGPMMAKHKLPAISKGSKLWEQAKKLLPGGSQLLSKKSERILPKNWPSYFKSAKGVEATDLDGNTYIDMSYMAVGPAILGYADPDVNAAVKKVIDEGSISTLNNPEEVELAELLLKLHPWAQKVRYARTGGEAMAIAVRIARAASKKDAIAFCGYHGWHDWYLATNLADDKNLDGHLLPGLDPLGVPRNLKDTMFPFHYNKIVELEKILKSQPIGVIVMEPMRHQEPEKDFFKKVRQLADKYKAILIIDEISAGWRSNVGGLHLKLGIKPDIAVFSKAMSNGYPMAAIIGKGKIMEMARFSFISSTYWSERVGPAAALATIRKLQKQKVPQHLNMIGGMIGDIWRKAAKKHGLDITVEPPNATISFSFNYENPLELRTLFTQEMLKRGYLAVTSVYVSYAHKKDHMPKYATAIDEVFAIIKYAIDTKNVKKLLEGPVLESGFARLT